MRARYEDRGRRGVVLVFFAMMVFVLLAVAALTIDMGFALLSRRQMQTAADTGALEGLRNRDALSDSERRQQVSQLVADVFDDDLNPANGDAVGFGAGPVVNFSGGLNTNTQFRAAQLLTPGAPYKPQLRPNLTQDPAGDMVSGTYSAAGSHVENPDYSRGDFTPDSAGATPPGPSFLVRLRRTGEPFDPDSTSSSAGPTLPYLFARGSLLAPELKATGIRVRATAIADAWPALSVGSPFTPLSTASGGAPTPITTTLSGSLDNATQVTTITVASAAGFPQSDSFRIVVDGGQPTAESMLVSGGAGTTTWTVQRDATGLMAHSSGATVTWVVPGLSPFGLHRFYWDGLTANSPAPAAVDVNGQILTNTTSLSAAIDNQTTTINVASAASFPQAIPSTGFFRILVNNEIMHVTDGAGTTTWTVQRGTDGTTAANHQQNATVVYLPAGLTQNIDGQQTTLTVDSAAGFPQTGSFLVLVDPGQAGAEIMQVTAQVATGNGTTTWTVQRGLGGTTAAAHNQNAAVVYIAGQATRMTNLAQDLDASSTSLAVKSFTGFPQTAPSGSPTLTPYLFRIRIDSEVMGVTQGAGTATWTVVRGIDGTTAAAHAQNSVVLQVGPAGIGDVFGNGPVTVQFPLDPTGRYGMVFDGLGGPMRVLGFGQLGLIAGPSETASPELYTLTNVNINKSPSLVAPQNVSSALVKPLDGTMTNLEISALFPANQSFTQPLLSPALVR